MKNKRYDIFISYRRKGGAQYARILQLMLQQRGYRVFLDYDELTDGVFGDHIKAAIKEAPIFMLVLSAHSMDRCLNEDDWVRQEILLAIEQGKHIIPVNPDNQFDGFPDDIKEKQLPPTIRQQISSHQYSEIGFGQTLGVTIDLMIQKRLVPTLGERKPMSQVDTDYETAMETLHKQDAHNRFIKRITITGVIIVVLMALGTCLGFWQYQKIKDAKEKVRTELQEKHKAFGLQLSPDLTEEQISAIDTLLMHMKPLHSDSLWISQFEFTVGLWYSIKGEQYDKSQRNMPMTDVSFGEIYTFLRYLNNITHLNVSLPSAEDWEYAAHGGPYHETTLYAGDDDINNVAWYMDNSEGHPHPSDGQQGKAPNTLDLYDMSGNVSELCNTSFDKNELYTICGGHYNSPATDVTVTSRAGFDTGAKASTVGFRIIITKAIADAN